MVAPEHKMCMVNTVHIYSMYTVCPYVLSTVGEMFLEIQVGFIELDKVITIFVYLCICL
jgi:hypothetical protein